MKKALNIILPILFVVLFVLVGLFIANQNGIIHIKNIFNLTNDKTLVEASVNRVVDGDTIEVNVGGNLKKVRLIGIDAAESVNPDETKNTQEGVSASANLKAMLPKGTLVYLEYETQRQDIYNRELCDVWLAPVDLNNIDVTNIDNLLNYKLVANGWAKAKTYLPNDKYSSYFDLCT